MKRYTSKCSADDWSVVDVRALKTLMKKSRRWSTTSISTPATAPTGTRNSLVEQLVPVGDGEQQKADPEPEQATARERRQLRDEQEPEQGRERDTQPVPALEPQVDRRQDEQRDDQHHAEMVWVAGEAGRPVDVRLAHRAEDVDRLAPPVIGWSSKASMSRPVSAAANCTRP